MKNAGYPLTIFNYLEPTYDQILVTNSLLKIAMDTQMYDFYIPLDADEFIYNPLSLNLIDIFKSEIQPGNCGLFKWVNYAPINDFYFTVKNPLFELFRKRNTEPTQFYKVVIPHELAKLGTTTMGNHQFLINGMDSSYSFISPFLQHCPVRSSQQIITKAIIGSHRFSIKIDRKINEGFHWDNITHQIRSHNYTISSDLLKNIALKYATNNDISPNSLFVVDNSERIGLSEDIIEFDNLSNMNPIKNFDLFSLEICNKLNSFNIN